MKTITRIIKRLEQLRKEGYDCDEDSETLDNGATGLNLYIYKPAIPAPAKFQDAMKGN